MRSYSQIGQDIFVKRLLKEENYRGYFVEIGGHLPTEINNTMLLEESGWNGISFDIIDYRQEWKIRNTPLLIEDAVNCDFVKIFSDNSVPDIVDYLSVDVELEGERYKALLNCWKAGREYKIITIEHDSHMGYSETEREPQRNFLSSEGYYLLFGNVKNSDGVSYEDWWINPKFFDTEKLEKLASDGEVWSTIIEKIKYL
jgi:hypothetical protein